MLIRSLKVVVLFLIRRSYQKIDLLIILKYVSINTCQLLHSTLFRGIYTILLIYVHGYLSPCAFTYHLLHAVNSHSFPHTSCICIRPTFFRSSCRMLTTSFIKWFQIAVKSTMVDVIQTLPVFMMPQQTLSTAHVRLVTQTQVPVQQSSVKVVLTGRSQLCHTQKRQFHL